MYADKFADSGATSGQWNKAKQCWVDEKFHVLDNVRLFQRP